MTRRYFTRRRDRRHGHHITYRPALLAVGWVARRICPSGRCDNAFIAVPARLRHSSSVRAHLNRIHSIPAFEETTRAH